MTNLYTQTRLPRGTFRLVDDHHTVRPGSTSYKNTIKSAEYSSYFNMIIRCYYESSPTFENYGARGIRVCRRWIESFEAFLRDMGPRPDGMSLDRVNPDGHYTPANCRWATASEQAVNKRAN